MDTSLSPAVLIFVSTNVVNAGNFAFNILFSCLMTPQEFADLTFILTVKLVVLCIFTALQMAVSKQVADEYGPAIAAIAQLAGRPRALFLIVLAGLIAILWFSNKPLGQGLAMLALACPLILPLVILRGFALGHLDMARTLTSAQLEMIIRLILTPLVWVSGWGLAGVGTALFLSLLAAWLPLRGVLSLHWQNSNNSLHYEDKGYPRYGGLLICALPFCRIAVGAGFNAGWRYPDRSMGLRHPNSRLSGSFRPDPAHTVFCLLWPGPYFNPLIIKHAHTGRPLAAPLMLIGGLFALTAMPLIALSLRAPHLLIGWSVGSAYSPAAPLAWIAVFSACLLTYSYLVLSALIALRSPDKVYQPLCIMLALAATQMAGQALIGSILNDATYGLDAFLAWKLACQAALALIMTGYGVHGFGRHISGQFPPLSS